MVMMAFRRLGKLSTFASRGLFSPGVSSGSGANFGYTVLFVCLFFFSAQKQILLLMMPATNWHRYEIHCTT